jgi:hypothetical protein
MASVETANVGMFHHIRNAKRELVELTFVNTSRRRLEKSDLLRARYECYCMTRVKKMKSKDAPNFYYGAGPMFRRSVH